MDSSRSCRSGGVEVRSSPERCPASQCRVRAFHTEVSHPSAGRSGPRCAFGRSRCPNLPQARIQPSLAVQPALPNAARAVPPGALTAGGTGAFFLQFCVRAVTCVCQISPPSSRIQDCRDDLFPNLPSDILLTPTAAPSQRQISNRPEVCSSPSSLPFIFSTKGTGTMSSFEPVVSLLPSIVFHSTFRGFARGIWWWPT